MDEGNYWTRLQRRSLSRRTMLRGTAVAGAGLAGAALIGCGDDDDDDGGGGGEAAAPAVIEGSGLEGAATSEEIETGVEEFDWIFEQPPKNVPILGGTRVSTTSTGFDHFSPMHLGGAGTGYAGYDQLYTRFFRGDNKLLLHGISNVERPDEITNILTVREGRIGPNDEGIDRPVVAEDIFLAMRVKNEDITVWNPGLYYGSTDWDRTEMTDDKTITLMLMAPRNDFFRASNMSFPAKEMSEQHLSGERTYQEWDKPPGSGPYYQTALTPGTKLEMTRNPDFSRAPWPYIENLKIINITDPAGIEAQFRGGATLSFSTQNNVLFSSILDDLGGGTQPSVYGVKVPSRATGPSFGMSSTLRDPFQDVRMREAVTRAIDKDKTIEIIGGGEGNKTGPGIVSFYTDWHVPMDDPQLLDWLTYDPQKSRQLLDALRADGVNVDREFLYLFNTGNQQAGDQATLGKQFFDEVGLKIKIEGFPSAEMSSRILRRSTADFDFTATTSGPPEPAQQLRTFHTQANYVAEAFCMCDPKLDALIEDWEVTTDEGEIASKAIEIQRYLMENWAVVFFWFLNFTRVLFKITLRNINPFEAASGQFSWIDESYLQG